MDVSYVLKHKLEDFVVEEVSVPALGDGGQHANAVLQKSGMTTSEALHRIAEHWSLDPLQVVAAGLKDEDGITRQTISVQHSFTEPLRIQDTADRWLTVSAPVCRSDNPQVKGALIGNNFWITVRRVDHGLADAFRGATEGRPFVNHYFINYFDRQRFGLPGSDYRTPAVGAALLSGELDDAAQMWLKDISAILDRGQDLPHNYRQFYERVRAGTPPAQALDQFDPRSQAFFVSSHFSRLWNTEVSDYLKSVDRLRLYHDPAHPLHDCYGVRALDDLSALPAVWPLKEALFSSRTRQQVIRCTRRPVVLSAKFFLLDHGPDQDFPGYDCLRLFLFLPSGCYASAALHQLLTHLRGNQAVPPMTDTAPRGKQSGRYFPGCVNGPGGGPEDGNRITGTGS